MKKSEDGPADSGNYTQDLAEAHGDPITYLVIGRGMEVHRELGPGLDEVFYHRLLSSRLQGAGIPHQSKPRAELIYRGHVADVFVPDLVIPDRLVIELKAQRVGLTPECLTQLLSYLKFLRIPIGLLFDFGRERLIFQRVIHSEPDLEPFPDLKVPAFVCDNGLAATVLNQIKAVFETHGLGYRDTTYRGLLLAAFCAETIPCTPEPSALVGELGQTRLRCLVVDHRCVLMISALGEGLSAAERAVTQTYLRLLHLPWGLAVHFGKRAISLAFVVHPNHPPNRVSLTLTDPRAHPILGKSAERPRSVPAIADQYSI